MLQMTGGEFGSKARLYYVHVAHRGSRPNPFATLVQISDRVVSVGWQVIVSVTTRSDLEPRR